MDDGITLLFRSMGRADKRGVRVYPSRKMPGHELRLQEHQARVERELAEQGLSIEKLQGNPYSLRREIMQILETAGGTLERLSIRCQLLANARPVREPVLSDCLRKMVSEGLVTRDGTTYTLVGVP